MTGEETWLAYSNTDMSIRNPIPRYLHKYMAHGFLGVLGGPHNMRNIYIDLLREWINDGSGHHFDLACIIASHLESCTVKKVKGSHADKGIVVGGLVTLIAKSYGLVETANMVKSRVMDQIYVDMPLLKKSKWVAPITPNLDVWLMTTTLGAPCPIDPSRLSLAGDALFFPSRDGDYEQDNMLVWHPLNPPSPGQAPSGSHRGTHRRSGKRPISYVDLEEEEEEGHGVGASGPGDDDDDVDIPHP